MAFSAVKSHNLKQLIEILRRYHGIDIEVRDELGNTLLNMAVQNGDYEITAYLLKENADINT